MYNIYSGVCFMPGLHARTRIATTIFFSYGLTGGGHALKHRWLAGLKSRVKAKGGLNSVTKEYSEDHPERVFFWCGFLVLSSQPCGFSRVWLFCILLQLLAKVCGSLGKAEQTYRSSITLDWKSNKLFLAGETAGFAFCRCVGEKFLAFRLC